MPLSTSSGRSSTESTFCPGPKPGQMISIRWRPQFASGPDAEVEWAEVIRRESDLKSLCCETLAGQLFFYDPSLVAEGRDEKIRRVEVVKEGAERNALRKAELARLHKACEEDSSELKTLPLWTSNEAADASAMLTAPPQVRVKVTLMNPDVAKAKRQALQSSLENQIEAMAERIHQEEHQNHQPLGCANNMGRTARHKPELCMACIRKADWCAGFLHLPNAPQRLAAAAQKLLVRQPSAAASKSCAEDSSKGSQAAQAVWRRTEAGLEAVMHHGFDPVLVQLRPFLFCVSEQDVQLFGAPTKPPAVPKKEKTQEKEAKSRKIKERSGSPMDNAELVEDYFGASVALPGKIPLRAEAMKLEGLGVMRPTACA